MTIVCTAVVALAAPAVAAAARPTVTTGGVAAVSQTGAQVAGTVDPNGRATRFYFEYGPTTAYGSVTDGNPAPRIGRAAGVLANVANLQPFTRYHYRIVAFNRDGQSRGRDRTFRTLRVPLALSLGASPNPVIAGRAVTLSGTLGGTGNAGRRIRLRSNPFPFPGGLNPVGNSQVTDAAGAFSFAILSVPVTTQFQVQIEGAPEVASAVVTVGAAVRVTTSTQRRRLARGVSVRFAGRIFPARDGVLVEIQKRVRGNWRTVKRTTARHARAGYSRYAKRFRIRKRGAYRVVVNSDGQFVGNAGRVIRIRPRG
jgi:hypothetical protein